MHIPNIPAKNKSSHKIGFSYVKLYRESQKKRTFRMLLEPQCTGSIISSQHPIGLEMIFLVVFY